MSKMEAAGQGYIGQASTALTRKKERGKGKKEEAFRRESSKKGEGGILEWGGWGRVQDQIRLAENRLRAKQKKTGGGGTKGRKESGERLNRRVRKHRITLGENPEAVKKGSEHISKDDRGGEAKERCGEMQSSCEWGEELH